MMPHGVEVFVSVEPIDLRWGFERLSGLVEAQLGRKTRSGALFVFLGKRRYAVKVLFFDGSGLCIFYKRLDRGTFRVMENISPGAASVTLDDQQLETLLDGIVVEERSKKRQAAHRVH